MNTRCQQDDQEATVHEIDSCHESRWILNIPPMLRRWKITDEPGERIQGNNDRTTEEQGWYQDSSCIRHQNSKAFHSAPKEAETYLNGTGIKDDITSDHRKKQSHGRPRSWNSSTRKTTRKWWRTRGRARPCAVSSQTNLIWNMWM